MVCVICSWGEYTKGHKKKRKKIMVTGIYFYCILKTKRKQQPCIISSVYNVLMLSSICISCT